MTSVQLTTSDGHVLAADLVHPSGEPRGGVAVCHPHPLYGGNRFNPMVEAVFRRLPDAGFVALRFDFRADHGGGETEPLDVVAALDTLAGETDGPLAVAGYSFGASVALRASAIDTRITALALVAPPLAHIPTATPRVPTLVLAPRHDQITPLDDATRTVDGWEHATLEIVESADHFLAGHVDAIATRAVDWLATDR